MAEISENQCETFGFDFVDEDLFFVSRKLHKSFVFENGSKEKLEKG